MNQGERASASASRWRERFWKLALFTLLVGLTYVMLAPPDAAPPSPPFPYADKAQHALAFAGLGLLASRAYADKPRWGVYASLVFYGACIEIAQPQNGRAFELLDLVADAVGAIAVFAAPRRRALPADAVR